MSDYLRLVERIHRDRANKELAERLHKAYEPRPFHRGLVWTLRLVVVAISFEILVLTFEFGRSVEQGTPLAVSAYKYLANFAWLACIGRGC